MKNKKGFTLIELLAVIAILALIVLLVVPNIIKIYNENNIKIMIGQENNISTSAKNYIQDYCLNPIDDTYECPSTFNIDDDNIKYVCLNNLIETKYIENDVKFKNNNCNGFIVFDESEKGSYTKAKTYLFCGNSDSYSYQTDNVNVPNSVYTNCGIAKPIPVNNCTYDGELVQGAEYINGQYTYRYKQQGISLSWENINEDGWGVKLTDKDSTDAVTTPLCTSINGKPIVSMSYMFVLSQATALNLSSFDTSNVTNMSRMFYDSQATTIVGLGNFDTSNVTNMSYMFYASKATTLDLSSFDTSKVTNMRSMFYGSKATILDLSSFDTSNVTDMRYMFSSSQATSINLSSFDTSKVTNMSSMFDGSKATTLDLSNFNTSNVTDMSFMFYQSQATILDLSSFDTSNVTNMNGMFYQSQATTLDLSSFDTSKVTNMSYMFNGSKAATIYVSNKWNTSRVTISTNMFNNTINLVGGAGTRYSSSNPIDKTYARVDGGTSNPGYFTLKTN